MYFVSGYTALSDDQIKASLLTAVEDKIKRKLRDNFSQAQVTYILLMVCNKRLLRVYIELMTIM